MGLTLEDGSVDSRYIYDAFGNQLDSSADINPFRYCGEYYDAETGLIYLRARYYDSANGRFISEDPIQDGLNWYSYCGGNPVAFVDPLGLYYIIANSTYCNCMDPRCKNFSTLDGTYTVYADTWATVIARNLIGLLPGGAALNISLELMTGVVGGNTNSGVQAITIDAMGELGTRLFPKFATVATAVGNVVDIIRECDIAYMDGIAFNLIKRNNISTTSKSAENLDQMLQKAYGFIAENDKYFSIKYDGQGTLYEIDNKIVNSRNPEQTITSLVYRYESHLYSQKMNGALINNDQIDKYTAAYESLLKDYKSRINLVNEEFSDYVQ